MESLSEILENVSEALILCRVMPDNPSTILEVKAINQKAREMLDWTGNLSVQPPLEKIISSQSFIDSLAAARSSGTTVPGVVEWPSDTISKQQINYVIKSIHNHVLIRLEKNLSPMVQAMGEHMQNNPLIRLAVFEAVRNEDGGLENLRLTYKNRAATENAALQVSIEPGQYLTDWYPLAKQTGLFPQFAQVIETGVPLITERFYPELGEGYEMVASRFGDGLIITYYNTIEKRLARRLLVDWQKIVDSSEDAISMLSPIRSPQGQIVDFSIELINASAIRTGQLTYERVARSSLLQLYPMSKDLITFYAGVIETGEPLRIERVVQVGDRQVFMDLSASKLNDKLLIIAKDVTANQRVIQDLERQQNLLDGIINTSENLMFVAEGVHDPEGRIVDLTIVKDNQRASTAFATLLGWSILGKSPQDVFGEDKALFLISLGVMESGKPVTIEQQFEERLGRWYRIFFRKVEQYLVVTYADITEIQEARLEAEQRNTLLSAMMENSMDGVFAMEAIRNAQGQITDFVIRTVNHLAVEVTELPYDALVGNRYGKIFPQVQENGFLTELAEAAQAGVSLRKECSFFVGEKDRVRWCDFSMTPASGDIFVLNFRDITEMVGWRKEQERLLNELKRSNKSLEQFAYIASHDLQEPTRKIRAFGNLILKQFAAMLPESGQDMLRRMVSASERMQGMIDSLLMYSRFSNQPRQTAVVSLQKSVEQVLTDLDINIREIDASVQVGTLPTVTGNETQFYQLFLNLINNALKFINKNERTKVEVSSGPPSKQELDELGFDPTLPWHAIRVADNGIGFDESNRTRIFELFRRLHGQSEYSGSGMGLAICKLVAEQHGGGITVHSTPGVGTTFVVVLPVPKE